MKRVMLLTLAAWLPAASTAAACSRGHSAAGAIGPEGSDTAGVHGAVGEAEAGDATDAGVVRDTDGRTGGRVGAIARGAIDRVAGVLGLGARPRELPPYTGTDARGIPRYARRPFSDEERRLLRGVYGIEDPTRLYVSDSTEDGLLKYDTRVKRCRTCYVNSYRVGFISVRRSGESWEQAERRVRAMRRRDFPPSARATSNRSTADLDPDIRAITERMLADARRAGFAVRVVATYRSPEHEAYLMAIGGGRTFTLTSLHSYGRAIDVVIGDGNLRRRSTRAQWVAFRRWVTKYKGDTFRILGTPDRTWDWRHVEMPTGSVGFRSIEDALERARTCAKRTGATNDGPSSCDFRPNVPSDIQRPKR